MVRPAVVAWCTMVTLPVLAGTVKEISFPTGWVPNFCTCPLGSALLTTGREQDDGTQSAGCTQALLSSAHGWHCGSLEEHAATREAARISVASLVIGAPPDGRVESAATARAVSICLHVSDRPW